MKKFSLAFATALAVSSAWAQSPSSSSALSISDMTFVAGGPSGISNVVGLATKTTNATLHSASIVFNIYDGDGDLLGNTIALASNVAPGDRWKFSAPMPYPTAHSVKAVRVDAN